MKRISLISFIIFLFFISCNKEESVTSKEVLLTKELATLIKATPEYQEIMNEVNLGFANTVDTYNYLSEFQKESLKTLKQKYITPELFHKNSTASEKELFSKLFPKRIDNNKINTLIYRINTSLSDKYSFNEKSFLKALSILEASDIKSMYVRSCEELCRDGASDAYHSTYYTERWVNGLSPSDADQLATMYGIFFYQGCISGCTGN